MLHSPSKQQRLNMLLHIFGIEVEKHLTIISIFNQARFIEDEEGT
jgi:hypothetical protein